MSAEKQRTQTESGFASEGHADYIDFYLDAEKFHKVSEWQMPAIRRELAKYAAFMEDANILPTHRAKAAQNRGRLQFEADYRDGKYESASEDMSAFENELTPETV